ncbi:hypothetical protein NKG94_32045 [Micromonospora sp. M12]
MEYSPDHDALRPTDPARHQPGVRPLRHRPHPRRAGDLRPFGAGRPDRRAGHRGRRRASYVTFTGDGLTERDLAVLGNLSAGYALFEIVGELLRPIEWSRLDRYDDDLLTIQKYPGKTNEQFTAAAQRHPARVGLGHRADQPAVPGARPALWSGTTLNQALMYGFDAAGVERDQKDVEAYRAFITTWLKQKRVKHRVLESGPVRRERKVVGRRVRIEVAPTREEHKAGQTQLLDVVNADTTRSGSSSARRPSTWSSPISRTACSTAAVPLGRVVPRPAGVARGRRAGLGTTVAPGAPSVSPGTPTSPAGTTRRRRWPMPA